jgi:hypothetical protein
VKAGETFHSGTVLHRRRIVLVDDTVWDTGGRARSVKAALCDLDASRHRAAGQSRGSGALQP